MSRCLIFHQETKVIVHHEKNVRSGGKHVNANAMPVCVTDADLGLTQKRYRRSATSKPPT